MFIKIFKEITDKKYRYLLLLAPLLFGIAAIYAYYLFITPTGMVQHIQTILFIAVLLIIALYNIYFIFKTNDIFSTYWIIPLIYTLAIHLGLLLGIALSGYGNDALWVSDSYTYHVPYSINIAHFLQGTDFLHGDGRPYLFTHILVGIVFSIFGINAISSAITLLIAKLVCIFIIFYLASQIFNKKIAAIALILYVFIPEIIFHTIIFYKEAILQMLIALVLLSMYMIFIKNEHKLQWYILLILSLLLVSNERFYILPMFIIPILGYIFFIAYRYMPRIYLTALIVFGILTIYLFFTLHSNIAQEKSYIDYIFYVIKAEHVRLNTVDGVDPINLTLPYPLALIKITFTPYFSIGKFATFINLAELLNWGAVLNQLVIMLAIIGVFYNMRINWKQTLFMVMPFSILLLLYASFGPYNARVRDSFYPLVVIYAAYAMHTIVLYYQVNKKNKIFIHKEEV